MRKTWKSLIAAVAGIGMLGLAGPRAAGLLGLELPELTCPACANFVTTADLDGPGPLPAYTRMHRDLIANLPYVLDVDGPLPPLPLGVVPLPGYELSATVSALNADRPTVRISKLATVLGRLPVRVEVVSGDLAPSATKSTFGYDTLDSSAPQTFTAALDLTDRDNNAGTSNVFADLNIGTTERSLTLVSEEFTGRAAGERTNRAIRRLTLRGNSADGTSVPSRATLEATTAAKSQRVVVTRNARTVADVELIEPNGGTRVNATLDVLPARVDMTAVETPTTEKQIAWLANDGNPSGVVGSASLQMVSGGATSKAVLTDLPSSVLFTFRADSLQTLVTYGANSRATRAEFTRIDGPRTMVAWMEHVPATITKLLYEVKPDGGHVDYESDGRATAAEVTVTDGPKLTRAGLTNVPGEMDIVWATAPGGGQAAYDADAVAESAVVEFIGLDAQHLKVDLEKFPDFVNLSYAKGNDGPASTTHVEYTGSSEVPLAQITGRNMRGLPGGATDLNATIERLPTGMAFDTRSTKVVKTFFTPSCRTDAPNCEIDPNCDYSLPDPGVEEGCEYKPIPRHEITETTAGNDLSVSAINGRLGLVDVQFTNGSPARLPEATAQGHPQDGVLHHDLRFDSTFVLHARLRELETVTLDRGTFEKVTREESDGRLVHVLSQSTLDTTLDSGGSANALTIDQKSSQPDSSLVKGSDATLARLPSHIELHQFERDVLPAGTTTISWKASAPVSGVSLPAGRIPAFSYAESSKVGPFPAVVGKRLTLEPMPSSLRVCKTGFGPDCAKVNVDDAAGIFDENIDDIAAGTYGPIPGHNYNCLGNGCNGPGIPIRSDRANKGSLVLVADVDTGFNFQEGTTSLHVTPLRRFAFQAHSEEYDCLLNTDPCQVGYIAIDTDGRDIVGTMSQESEDGANLFAFPPVPPQADGFSADRHVFAFDKTGLKQGEVAITGPVNCPEGTIIKTSGSEHTKKFCAAHLTETDFL